MLKMQSEVRMIWLMVLIITAVGTWFLDVPILTYLCIVVFVMSVIQYVDAIQKPTKTISDQISQSSNQYAQFDYTSKVPLYISSILAVVGGWIDLSWMVGLGVTLWIFFFLRWLRRLENNLDVLNHRLSLIRIPVVHNSDELKNETHTSSLNVDLLRKTPSQYIEAELNFTEQIKYWVFGGNPVLKVAILVLVVGVILLLRFATEHWQLSLALKLGLVAVVSGVITAFGYALKDKNRSFALALEGLGLAGLFLTLFFAYYNQVISNFALVSLCFVAVMLLTLTLSLKQQTIELALMAMMIAYVAPFTLPVRDATAVELVAYYLVINVAVAIISTLRPWKMLNQIAFIVTILMGGGYAFLHGYHYERYVMTGLVLAHSSIFIWLSFRFSQLIAKADLNRFKLKPVLDVALIFSTPIVGYILIYLMHFENTMWQAGMSLVFACVYAILYMLAKNNQSIALISQSYFSLVLIFLALIPPILLPEQWSVVGWAIEGTAILCYALYQQSNIGRYLAMGLLVVAGFSSFYYWIELSEFPRTMFWILTLCYFVVLLVANSRENFQKQMSILSTVFLSILSLSATTMLLILCVDYFDGLNQWVVSLLLVSITFICMNEWMHKAKAAWSWLLPKWFALVVLFIFAFAILIQQSEDGVVLWNSTFSRVGFAVATLFMSLLWLRPIVALRTFNEWVSLGLLSTLALASLTLIPKMPFISMVILPLLFCAYSYFKKTNSDWQFFWQARSSLVLMMTWIICSQLFSQQAFKAYLFPILNPFDLISLTVWFGFIWVLALQLKSGLDRGIAAVLVVLSLLWLSSYTVLRALHIYLETPYNDLALWKNAVVQLSLTLLWVSLAFVTMSLASRKQLRSIWVLGGSILFIVTLKLVLLDLSHVGTLTRVFSFLGAGLVMLILAYIAPIPESDHTINHSST